MADFQQIEVDGEILEFPVDMSDAEISSAISGKDTQPEQSTTGRQSALDNPLAGEGLKQFLGFGQGAVAGAVGTVDLFVPDEFGGKDITALEQRIEKGAREFGSPTSVEAGKLFGLGGGIGGVVATTAKQLMKSKNILGVTTILSEIGGFVKRPVSKLLLEAAKDPAKFALVEAGISGVAGAAGAQVSEDDPWTRLGVEILASFGAAGAANRIDNIRTGLANLNPQEREVFDVLMQADDGIDLIEAGERAIRDAGIKNSDVPLQTITGSPTVEASIAKVRGNNAELDNFFENADKRVIKALNNANVPKTDEASVVIAFDKYRSGLRGAVKANIAKQMDIDSRPGDTAEASEALFGHLIKTEDSAHKVASTKYDDLFADKAVSGIKLGTKAILKELRGVTRVADKDLLGVKLRKVSEIVERMTKGKKDLSVKDLQDVRSKIMGDVREIRQASGGDTAETISMMKVADKISEQLDTVPQLKDANATWRVYKDSFYDGQIARFFAKSATGKNKVAAERFMSAYITGSAPKDAARQLKRIASEFDPDGSRGLATTLDDAVESGFFAILKSEQMAAAAVEGGIGQISPATWRSFMKKNSTALKEYGLFDKFKSFRKTADRAAQAKESLVQMERYGFAGATRGQDIDTAIGEAIKEKNGLFKVLKMVKGNRFLTEAVKDRFMTSMLGLKRGEKLPDPTAMVKVVKNNSSTIRDKMGEQAFRRAEATSLIIQRTFSGIGKGRPGTPTSQKEFVTTERGLKKARGKVTAVIGHIARRVFLLGADLREMSTSKKAAMLFKRAYTDPKAQQEIIKLAKKDPETFRMAYTMAMTPAIVESDAEAPNVEGIKASVIDRIQQ